MRGVSVKEAAAILCGRLINEKNADEEILSVVIDSRKVEKGAMFAALKGEHADGHDYIAKAYRRSGCRSGAEGPFGSLPQTL